MDFSRPSLLLGPTLDGDVLLLLASVETEMTGREIARRAERRSHQGILNALDRLVNLGIVSSRRAGTAKLYRLNREHVAAPWIEGLAGLRQQTIDRVKEHIGSWRVQPSVAAIFGSVARGTAGAESDIDLLLVRPMHAPTSAWDDQVARLISDLSAWTGNDARVLELSEEELRSDVSHERVLGDVADQGIEVGGSLEKLRRVISR